MPIRVVGEALEGAAKPIGGDDDGYVKLQDEQRDRERARAVAAEADAPVVVVAAYSPADAADAGARKELHGREAAFQALDVTVKHLTSDRVRNIEQRVVAGDPAQALLAAAEDNPHNLIVVGNRGLGAEEGQMLGVVPAAVVKDAHCDVLIVQGTRDRARPRRT